MSFSSSLLCIQCIGGDRNYDRRDDGRDRRRDDRRDGDRNQSSRDNRQDGRKQGHEETRRNKSPPPMKKVDETKAPVSTIILTFLCKNNGIILIFHLIYMK